MLDPFSLVLLGEGVLIGPMLAGSILYSQQKYERAARAFELAARFQPLKNLRATCYINLSACHAELAQPERTLEACDMAEKASHSRYVRALAHINRAHAYLLLGRMEESQREAERAIELSPHWRRGVRYAMVNYADAMGRMGRYAEALETARKAFAGGGPSDALATGAARREIGMLLVQMGRPREALHEMDLALHEGPGRADHRGMIYQIMASAWVALGDAQEANRALDEAERLGVPPVNQPVLTQARARVAMIQGHLDQATSLLREVEPTCRTPLVKAVISAHLASCLWEKGRYGESLRRVHEVLDEGCQYRHIQAICHLSAAQNHFSQGNVHEGCESLESARQFDGMSPVLDAFIAVVHAQGSFVSERYEDSAQWAGVARHILDDLEGYPDLRRRALFWGSRSLTRLGKPMEARRDLDQALEHPGVNHREAAQLRHALAEAQLALGESEEAMATFRQCVELDSDYAPAWFSLGQLLGRQGQIEEAEACLRVASAADDEGTWGRDASEALMALQSRHAAAVGVDSN